VEKEFKDLHTEIESMKKTTLSVSHLKDLEEAHNKELNKLSIDLAVELKRV